MKPITRTICSAAVVAAASVLPIAQVATAQVATTQVSAAAVARPVAGGVSAAAPLPANLVAPVTDVCERDLGEEDVTGDETTTCELVARSGLADIGNGTSLPVWVFDDASGGPADVLNPVIEMYEGDDLVIKFQNDLAVPAGFSIPTKLADGQLAPDVTGLGTGGDTVLTYSGLEPGTYVYQPSPTPDANRQMAMGMGGIIIVRPEGYDPADSATYRFGNFPSDYTDEIVAVLHEFDPAFNANPMGADLAQFTPSIFTLNGRSYDGASPLPEIQQGAHVLVRAANLGLQQRRIGFSGVRTDQLTQNSRPLSRSVDQAALTVPPGDVVDGLSWMPIDGDVNVALFDRHMSSWQESGSALAGQVRIWHIPGFGSPVGPVIDAAAFVGGLDVFDSSSDAAFDAHTVPDAVLRYYIDDLGSPPVALAGVADVGGNISGVVPAADLVPLANGEHILWLQAGIGAAGSELWGPVHGVVFEMDRTGPVITGMTVTPDRLDGVTIGSLTLTGTADTTLTGPGTDVQVVKYSIDVPPADVAEMESTGTTLTFDGDNPLRASFTGDIPVDTLAVGTHTIHVWAQDTFSSLADPPTASDHWSAVLGEITFTIDNVAPLVDSVSIDPNPNNGTLAHPGSQVFLPSVRLSATISDVPLGDGTGSPIVQAEFSVGATAAAAGTGEPMQSLTANWGDSLPGTDPAQYVQEVYADIALADLRSLPEGEIVFWVRGQDAAGNWSEPISVVFVYDTTPPVITVAGPGGAGELVFGVEDLPGAGTTVNSPIVSVEWFVGADPGTGARNEIVLAPAGQTAYTGLVADGLGDGDVVTVVAADAAGNTTSVIQSVTDGSAPEITFGDPTGVGVVVVNATDPVAGSPVAVQSDIVAVEWFDGPVAGAPGTGAAVAVAGGAPTLADLVIDGLAPGQEITVTVTDAAGNAASATTTAGVGPAITFDVVTVTDVSFTVVDQLAGGLQSNIVAVEWAEDANPPTALAVPGDSPSFAAAVVPSASGVVITVTATDALGNTMSAETTVP